MAEGDTIHRTARRLREALTGRELRRFEAPRLVRRGPEQGTSVEDVHARGKHLLVGFSDGTTLHTHMRMTGAWHLYRPGERWRKPRSALRALVSVDGSEAVCFSAPVVELLRPDELRRHPVLRALGPDLCDPGANLDEALDRLARTPADHPIAEALLDQRIVAGVGNVYKSEVLFSCGLDPATPVGCLDAPARLELLETAARMLRENLGPGPRRTTPGGPRHAVYGRSGRPCLRCGTAIRMSRSDRVTYRCPSCQA